MANPNRAVFNARHKKSHYQFSPVATLDTWEEAQEAKQAAADSGNWTRLQIKTYRGVGYFYLVGVRKPVPPIVSE